MSTRGWTVARAWWEFTKLVLSGRGRYQLYVHPDGLPEEFWLQDWVPYHLSWNGGGDRYATLCAEPEDCGDER